MYRVIDYLKKHDVEFKRNLKLSDISAIKTGGSSRLAVYPENADEMIGVLRTARELGFEYKIVGNASNILFPDGNFKPILISTKRMNAVSNLGEIAFSFCGASLASMIRYMARRGFGGLESLFGIPATVGGAVFNNAGAFGDDISSSFLYGIIYSPREDKISILDNFDMRFSYRKSILQSRELVLLFAAFAFISKDEEKIKSEIKDNMKKRRSSQPTECPSLGSVFKKRDGTSVSALIDRLGMKGVCVGGAEISKKHAGFIVNRGGASSGDVIELIGIVKNEIYKNYGFLPDEEIEILK